MRRRLDVAGIAMLILASPILMVLAIVAVVGFVFQTVIVKLALLIYCQRGIKVLFVYSDSPVWKAYIESNILPRLPQGSIIMNSSRRKRWGRWSLPIQIFNYYKGEENYNPMGIVLSKNTASTYRFYLPFRAYEHGRDEELKQVESDFLAAIAQFDQS